MNKMKKDTVVFYTAVFLCYTVHKDVVEKGRYFYGKNELRNALS